MTNHVWPASVELMEVSPRDGLQDHPTIVPTEAKVELIRRAAAAGLRRVEVASFAHPGRVPQMADAEAVISATRGFDGLVPVALVLNERGLDRALAAGIQHINTVVVATETFSERNQGMSVAESLAGWARIAERSRAEGLNASVIISASFGCPYEGDADEDQVFAVIQRAGDAGPTSITLADTIGAAVPSMVEGLVGRAVALGVAPVRCHLHDTRNTGVANAVAAIAAGATGLDTSLGGLGGCPFAPGATGNVATEDVVWCLERMGIATGVDLGMALEAVEWMKGEFGSDRRPVGGAVLRAGPFP